MVGAVGGGALGSILGPMGTVGGAVGGAKLGQRADKGIRGWFGKGQAHQITPAYEKAINAVADLTQALTQAQTMGVDTAKGVQSAQIIQKFLKQVRQGSEQLDKQLQDRHDTDAMKAGGVVQKVQAWGKDVGQEKGLLGAVGRGAERLGQRMGRSKTLSRQAGIRGAVGGLGDKWRGFAKKHPGWAKALGTGGLIGTGMVAGGA